MADFSLDDLIDETLRDFEQHVPFPSRCVPEKDQRGSSARVGENASTDGGIDTQPPRVPAAEAVFASDASPEQNTSHPLAAEGLQRPMQESFHKECDVVHTAMHKKAFVFTSETAASVDALASEHWLGEETDATALSSSLTSSSLSSAAAPVAFLGGGDSKGKRESATESAEVPGARTLEESDHQSRTAGMRDPCQGTFEQPPSVHSQGRVCKDTETQAGTEELSMHSPGSSKPRTQSPFLPAPAHPSSGSLSHRPSSVQRQRLPRRPDPLGVCLRELASNITDSPKSREVGKKSESAASAQRGSEIERDTEHHARGDSARSGEGDNSDSEAASLSQLLQAALGLLSAEDDPDGNTDCRHKGKERGNGLASWMPSFFRGGGTTKKAETVREDKSNEEDVDFFHLLKEMSEEVEGEDLLLLAVGEPLKHLLSEFEPWFEKKKESLPEKDRHRYGQQIRLYRQIVNLCEKDEEWATVAKDQKDTALQEGLQTHNGKIRGGGAVAMPEEETDKEQPTEGGKTDEKVFSSLHEAESATFSSPLSSACSSPPPSSPLPAAPPSFPVPSASDAAHQACPLPSSSPSACSRSSSSSSRQTEGLRPPVSESRPSNPLAIVRKLSRLQELLDDLNSLGEPPEEVMEKLFPDEQDPLTPPRASSSALPPTNSPRAASNSRLPELGKAGQPVAKPSSEASSSAEGDPQPFSRGDSPLRGASSLDKVGATPPLPVSTSTPGTSSKKPYGPERPAARSSSENMVAEHKEEEERVIEDFLTFVEALERVEKEGGEELKSLLADPQAVQKIMAGDMAAETPEALLRLLDQFQFGQFQGPGVAGQHQKESSRTDKDRRVTERRKNKEKTGKAACTKETRENEVDQTDSCRQQ